MNKASIMTWIRTPQNKNRIIVGICVLAGIFILFFGIRAILEAVHNYRYEKKQEADKTAATGHQTNANALETNANLSANKQKELQANENIIIQKQANQQKVLADDERQSKSTRTNLNRALNQKLPNRADDSGTNDDQLRSDSDRAKQAFNGQ